MAAFKPSRDPRPNLKGTATGAHHIWAHPGPDSIRHLKEAVRGFKLQGSNIPPSWKEFEDCILTMMNQQISRRTPETLATQPFQRIAIDLVYLLPQGEECYNGDKYALHTVCQYSKWHEVCCIPNRLNATLIPAVFSLIEKIQSTCRVCLYCSLSFVTSQGHREYTLMQHRRPSCTSAVIRHSK
jgi:hypothetical protein